ncbi:MAG TPA: L-threonylcarbamoyladenylate synthase [Chloroflexota bacterium]|jgi:L-threonylcarbamoyladenylate synthase
MTASPQTVAWPGELAEQARVALRAAEVILAGGLVVYPTDTVYGLGADPNQHAAVQRIFQAKGRPDEKAIVWLVNSLVQVNLVVEITAAAESLAARFWPGPLTLILWRAHPSTDALPTLAVRAPAHPAALAIIAAVAGPVATTSANRSGAPASRSAEQAAAALGNQVELIVDAGPSPLGHESTIVDLTSTPPRIIRAGPVTAAALSEVLGTRVEEPA